MAFVPVSVTERYKKSKLQVNPGPKTKVKDVIGEIIRANKDLPEDIVREVHNVLTSPKTEGTVKIKAAEFLSDRGWGKPVQMDLAHMENHSLVVEFKTDLKKVKEVAVEAVTDLPAGGDEPKVKMDLA